MALLFMDGFDAGDVLVKWSAASSSIVTSSTITPYGSGRSVELSSSADIYRPITPSAQVTVGLAYQPVVSASRITVYFMADGGTILHANVMRNNSSGLLEIRRGGTILATGTTVLSAGTWYYIEMQATVADSGGTIKVRLNGASTNEIDFTGDTKNGGTSTLIDAIRIDNGSSNNRIDNMYALNSIGTNNVTFLGAVQVHTLTPNGNGSSSQFTGSDGNQVDNYQLVDELPYSTADYVGSSTSGQRDTYLLDNLPNGYHQIFGIQSNVMSLKNTAGTRAIKFALRSNGSVYYGAPVSLGTSAQTYSDMYENSPVTSLPWTSSEISNLEGGMEVV
ncbi:MAG TPA: hypothetical protein VFO38_03285 [Candidatus Saccharimonadales bacterium]|nr:hypothetical protein [Candidatus Saccharimonadales bacterium]